MHLSTQYTKRDSLYQGCHGQGDVTENIIVSRSQKSRGKVREFYFWLATSLGKGFLVGIGIVPTKDIYDGIDLRGFIACFIGKGFVYHFLEDWVVVSGKSLDISYPNRAATLSMNCCSFGT